jgi:putative YphP/YqiW family bacilliredoxin
MYPEEIVKPCREELTSIGVSELKTAEEVDDVIKAQSGTTLVVVNSVCGCAAGGARPGVRLALQHDKIPTRLTTVFAGVDADAVARARTHMVGYPPSSPSIALFKDGRLVFMMERHDIEGMYPEQIADQLKDAFNTHCTETASA